ARIEKRPPREIPRVYISRVDGFRLPEKLLRTAPLFACRVNPARQDISFGVAAVYANGAICFVQRFIEAAKIQQCSAKVRVHVCTTRLYREVFPIELDSLSRMRGGVGSVRFCQDAARILFNGECGCRSENGNYAYQRRSHGVTESWTRLVSP